MRNIFTKIICCAAATALSAGVILASACSNVYNAKPLDYTPSADPVVSNGGFAVEKGGYVYFINGKQDNTADNTFGEVVRGAIMRISKDDLSARNYASADTVVPLIAYSGNANAGIFIYGDYVYYSTPSTEKNSDGEVQNSLLEFKRTKLDGTETMKDYYVQLSDNKSEYRYVEKDGVVYLLYVATEELYGTKTTNLHSVNTKTKEDTLLAYNVSAVMFDGSDVTNPRVFYTMNVTEDFINKKTSAYNQLYTVTADATEPADYSEYFKEVFKDEEEGYDPEKDPLYVNCGTLVFDGIGKIQGMMDKITVFNHKDADKVERSAYTYTISDFRNGTLFYTRKPATVDTASLFSVKVDEVVANDWNPVLSNDSASYILRDGSSASSYTYLFDAQGDLSEVLIADSNGFIKTTTDENGVILTEIDNEDTFYITTGKQPTALFTAKHGDTNYIYYSITEGNGYSVNRVGYDGTYNDYNNPFSEKVDEYVSVPVLDLDGASDWYKPELIEGQILFATQTDDMTEYPYIMACDIRARENGAATDAVMSNSQIKELNDLYESINEKIEDIDEEEELYKNLKNALRFAHFTGDADYIDKLIKAYVDIEDYEEEQIWSKVGVGIYKDFVAAAGDWAEFGEKKVKVNGVDVASNMRDYYYAVLGKMTDADKDAYIENLKTTYMQAYPEVKTTWFEGLSTGAKVGFIVGVCAGGLLIIAAATVTGIVITRKRKAKLPTYTKKRIKVDTTDDKNIDVYSDEQ